VNAEKIQEFNIALTSYPEGERIKRKKRDISLFYPVISVFSVIQLLFLE
jgi:hypothetical protein